MKTTFKRQFMAIALVASVVLGLCCGCNEGNSNLKLNPLYTHTLTGALIGGIVGHQSEEPGEGAAVGAVIFGVAELLHQIDEAAEKEEECEDEDEQAEEVVTRVRNSDGSVTPVVLRKQGWTYIGPNGERYEQLPTEEQLRPIYGL
jgi:hypothetical protein